jgi:hypothetical protein
MHMVVMHGSIRALQAGLDSHNRNLKRVALFTLVFFAMNVLVSGLLLFLPQADITYGVGYIVAR